MKILDDCHGFIRTQHKLNRNQFFQDINYSKTSQNLIINIPKKKKKP